MGIKDWCFCYLIYLLLKDLDLSPQKKSLGKFSAFSFKVKARSVNSAKKKMTQKWFKRLYLITW